MTTFSELPRDIILRILESLDEIWPLSQLHTNRTFYTYLKPLFYARIAEDNLICCEHHLKGFQETSKDHPDLLSLSKEFVLPMEAADPALDPLIYRTLHEYFSSVPACTSLHLAVHYALRRPTPAQAARLGNVTELILSGYVPCHPFEHANPVASIDTFEAWISHMPRLKNLCISHLSGLGIENLAHLPNTLVRLELLGQGCWRDLPVASLRSILSSLPHLRHFMLMEMVAPVVDVATVLDESLSASVTSFGIGFNERHTQAAGSLEGGRPVWEQELAMLFSRRYTALTFYLVTHFVDFVDSLAGSASAKSITSLDFQTPSKPYTLIQRDDRVSCLESMYKLLDRSVFPKLALITGGRIKEQMEKFGAWDDYVARADEARVHLARLEW